MNDDETLFWKWTNLFDLFHISFLTSFSFYNFSCYLSVFRWILYIRVCIYTFFKNNFQGENCLAFPERHKLLTGMAGYAPLCGPAIVTTHGFKYDIGSSVELLSSDTVIVFLCIFVYVMCFSFSEHKMCLWRADQHKQWNSSWQNLHKFGWTSDFHLWTEIVIFLVYFSYFCVVSFLDSDRYVVMSGVLIVSYRYIFRSFACSVFFQSVYM